MKQINNKLSFLVLLAITLISYSSFHSYNFYLEKYEAQIFADEEALEGFGMKNITRNSTLGEDKKEIALSLKPGESYEGELLIRNMEEDSNFIIETDQFNAAKEEEAKKLTTNSQQIPYTEIIKKKQVNSYAFIPYKIIVPINAIEGNYISSISTFPEATLKKQEDANVRILLKAAVKVELEVTQNPSKYEYKRTVSNPHKAAMIHTDRTLRLNLAILLGLISIYFLYLFSTNKK